MLFRSLLHRQIHPEHAVGKLSAGKAVDSAVNLHFIDPEYLFRAVAGSVTMAFSPQARQGY